MNKMSDAVNGWGPAMRLITPIMCGIIIAMMSYILKDMRDVKVSLNNHILHDTTEIKERLARVETSLTFIKEKGDDECGE